MYILSANLFLLLVSTYLFGKLSKSTLTNLLYGSYIGIYIIIMPTLYSFGYKFLSIPSDDIKYLQVLNISNLIFLCSSIIIYIIFLGFRKNPISVFPKFVRVNRQGKYNYGIPFAVFLLISLGSTIYMFGGLYDYLKPGVNQFSVVQDIKLGGWIFVVLNGFYIYPFLLLIPKYATKRSPYKLVGLYIIFVLVSLVIFKISTRSVLLEFLFIVISARVNYKNYNLNINIKNIFILLAITILSAYILIVGNSWRRGNLEILPSSFPGLSSVIVNFLQVENDLALIKYFVRENYLGFNLLWLNVVGYSLLPSIILPFAKVQTGVEYILTHLIFAGNLQEVLYSPNSTLTFGIPITGYAEFGYFGVLVSSVIYSALLSLATLAAKANKFANESLFTYLQLSLILGFRLAVETNIVTVYVFIICYALLAILSKCRVFSRPKGSYVG